MGALAFIFKKMYDGLHSAAGEVGISGGPWTEDAECIEALGGKFTEALASEGVDAATRSDRNVVVVSLYSLAPI